MGWLEHGPLWRNLQKPRQISQLAPMPGPQGVQAKKVHFALYFCQLAPINEGHRPAHGLCHGWQGQR
jgi:hypothetical protein